MAEVVGPAGRWELPSGLDRVVVAADVAEDVGVAVVALDGQHAVDVVTGAGKQRSGDGSVQVEVGSGGCRFVVDLRRVPRGRSVGVAVWAAPGQPGPAGDVALETLAGELLARRPLDGTWGPWSAAGVVAVVEGGPRWSLVGAAQTATGPDALARQLGLRSGAGLGATPGPAPSPTTAPPGAAASSTPRDTVAPTTPLRAAASSAPPGPAKDGRERPPTGGKERGRRRRRGRAVVAVVFVAAVAAGAAVLVPRLGEGDDLDRLADPKAVELPEPTEGDAVRADLEGDAHDLVELVDLAPLARGEGDWSPDTCRDLGPQLAAVGEPGVLRLKAQALSDPDTADMAGAYLDALVVFLAACASGEPDDVVALLGEDLEFTATVFSRRVDELGVAR